ncbi:glycosyltransferase [Desulfobacter postgatei]|uniref:glycosyltransferase n=1 Tax=Desulfobacter postgatei TaxID=2293 RepID=UPI002A35AAEE|nr:glycosyltransferase [Desulfobacter postgatei]MDX9965362.1 glycosyltransferase [Desulfobacter postgatei]
MESNVAIITRTKNRPLFLRRAISSVLTQAYPHWIHVIVNDGGDSKEVDAVVDLFRSEYGARIHVIHHDISLGMEAASNAGINDSKSDYILIHDDDDTLEPDFLSETVSYLEKNTWPAIKGVVTLTNRIDEHIEDNEVLQDKITLFRDMKGSIGFDDMAKINPFPPISFLFRRDTLNEIGLFDDQLPVLGDWDFNLRFLLKYDIGVIPKALANYHHRLQIKTGQMGNTIYAQLDRHLFYDTLVRNRYARMVPPNFLAYFMFQEGQQSFLLERLYRHPVIGRVIRFWSRWVNPNIPSSLS